MANEWPTELVRVLKAIGGDEGVGVPVLVDPRNFGLGKIINLLDPTDNQDAATKKYVDDSAALEASIVKAWIKYESSGTASIEDSFGVDTITDHGTGDQSINFISGVFNNALYSMTGLISRTTSNSTLIPVIRVSSTNPTTAALRINTGVPNLNRVFQASDSFHIGIQVFGGQ